MALKTLLEKNPVRYGILFDLFRRSSNETDVLLQRLIEPISNSPKQSLLDIGAADGTLTQKLMPYFDRIVAIEKEENNVYALRALGIEAHHMLWEDFKTDEKFEVVLASHILYYFNEESYLSECQRIREHLTPNGVGHVIINAHEGGYYNLINSFYPLVHNGNRPFSKMSNLEERLHQNNVRCSNERLIATISFENLTHFLHLCQFFLDCELKDAGNIKGPLKKYYKDAITPIGSLKRKQMPLALDFISIYTQHTR